MVESRYFKKLIILLSVITLFSMFNAYSEEIGCCYSPNLLNGYSEFYPESLCLGQSPSYFDNADDGCDNAKLICACNNTWPGGGYKFLGWTDAITAYSFPKKDTSILSTLIYSNYKCFAFCNNKILNEAKLSCESPLLANEICGLAAGEGKYCCIAANDQRGLTFDSQIACNENCGIIAGGYKIEGIVYDQTNTAVTNAYVSITGPGTSRIAITDTTGHYQFADIKSNNYLIKASKSTYIENSSNLGINGDTVFDIHISKATTATVDCTGISQTFCQNAALSSTYPAKCCNPACGIVSQLVLESAYSSSLNDPYLCTNGIDNNCNGKDDLTEGLCSIYNIPQTSDCGNKLIEQGEQCDGEYYCNSNCQLIGGTCGDSTFNPILEICDNSDLAHQISGCQDDCTLKAATQTQCERDTDCPTGATCTGGNCIYPPETEQTQDQCIQNPPISTITTKHTIENVNLIEINNDNCNAEFNLLRCTKTSTNECVPSASIAQMTSLSYKDKNIAPNTEYCYKVQTSYGTGSTTPSNVVCIKTGPDVCFKIESVSEKICYDNKVQHCDISNKPTIETDCDAQEFPATCVNINNDAQCIYQSQCDFCNIIYGTSPYNSFTVYISSSQVNPTKTQCELAKSCYLDYKISSVDAWQGCNEVNSCYDYKTSDACGANTCRNDNIGDCEWTYYEDSGALGYGVCSPTDLDKQDCSLCHEEDGILSCNYDTCGLYGACYYADKGITQGYQCIHKYDAGCQDFEFENDCIYSNFRYSAPNYNVRSDIVLNQSNNKIRIASDDYFGFGKCHWDSTKGCFKDANDNNLNDCDSNTELESSNVIDRKNCIKDNTNPITYISCPKIVGQKLNIDVTTSEKVKASKYNIIYKNDPYKKPEVNIINNKIQSVDIINSADMTSFFKGTGYYILNYYSIDSNNNPEEVQNCEMYIDSIKPTITINHDAQIVTQDYENNQFSSSLTVSISVKDNYDDPANIIRCSAHIKKGTNIYDTLFVNRIFHVGDQLYHKTYPNLGDDKYSVNVECTDYANNTKTQTKFITLNADDRIQNIKPERNTYHEKINNISFETKFNGDCYIASIPQNQNMSLLSIQNMNQVTLKSSLSNGNYLFTYPVSLSESKTYSYGIKCKFLFANLNTYETSSNSHKAIFAIDNTPPSISYELIDENGLDLTNTLINNPNYILTKPVFLNTACSDPEFSYEDGTKANFGFLTNGCLLTISNTQSTITTQTNTATMQIQDKTFYTINASDSKNTNQEIINAFTFDFDNAIMDLTVKDENDNIVTTLFPGTYRLFIESNKNLSRVNYAKIVLANDGASYSMRCDEPKNKTTSICTFNIGNGVEIFSHASIQLQVLDTHGLISNENGIRTIAGSTIIENALTINTLKPEQLEFLPEFNNEYINQYYTNSNSLVKINKNGVSSIYTNSQLLYLYGKTDQNTESYMSVFRYHGSENPNHMIEYPDHEIEILLTTNPTKILTFRKDQIGFALTNLNYIKFADTNSVQIYDSQYPYYANYLKIVNIGGDETFYSIEVDRDISNYCTRSSCKFYVADWNLDYNKVLDQINLDSGENILDYKVLKSDSLYSKIRSTTITLDSSVPTINTSIDRITNEQNYNFRIELCEDYKWNDNTIDSGLKNYSILLNNQNEISNSISNSQIKNDCFIEPNIGINLPLGHNNVSVIAYDNVGNSKERIYSVFFDPNALLINNFSIFNIIGTNVAKKVDADLYLDSNYLYSENNLNIIKNEGTHNYRIQFSEDISVDYVKVLGKDGVIQNITSFSTNNNELSFHFEDTLLKEGINKLYINAGKLSNPIMIEYELIFLFDNIAPEISHNIPQKLTRADIFDLNVNISKEFIRLFDYSVDQICYNGPNIVDSKLITIDELINTNDLSIYKSRAELSTNYQTKCDFIINAEDYAGNHVTLTVSRDVDSTAPFVAIKSVEPICEDYRLVFPKSELLYESQCSLVNVTVKLSPDATETKYSIKYQNNYYNNLYDIFVDDFFTCDGTYKCFSKIVPLEVADGLSRYTTITKTNFSIYAHDGNPFNYIIKEYTILYKDKDYSLPPNATIRFIDLISGQEVNLISYGSYGITINADTDVYNYPVKLIFEGTNGYIEDETVIGSDSNILSDYYQPIYDIYENSAIGQSLNGTYGKLKVNIHLKDNLGLETQLTKIIDFDMKRPILEFDPNLNHDYYEGILIGFDNKYYTNKNSLVFGLNSTEDTIYDIDFLSSIGLDQSYEDNKIESAIISPLSMGLANSINKNVIDVYSYNNPYNYNYITFKNNNQIVKDAPYPFRGTNFEILDVVPMTLNGRSFTRLTLDRDASMMSGKSNSVAHAKNKYSNLFSNNLLSLSPGTNTVSINGKDNAKNPSNTLSSDIVLDTQNGLVTSYAPTGCVADPNQEVMVKLRDFSMMSPYKSIELYVDGNKISTTENKELINNIIIYTIKGQKAFNYRMHNVKVIAKDYVGNIYSHNWTFEVNSLCNFNQSFSLNNGIAYNYGFITGENNINFDFELSTLNNQLNIDDFGIINEQVKIINLNTYAESQITQITKQNNVLNGIFATQDGAYKVVIEYKIQDKNNVNQIFGPFKNEYFIIVDQTSPVFIDYTENYTYSGSTLSVIANLNDASSLNYNTNNLYDDFNTYSGKFCFLQTCTNLSEHDNQNYILSYIVPDVDSGNYPYTLTLTDLVGNSLTKSGLIFIDNNPPGFNILNYLPESGKAFLSYPDYILTNSPVINLVASVSKNIDQLSFTKIGVETSAYNDMLIFQDSNGDRTINQRFSLVEGSNLFKIKIETTNNRVVYQQINIVLDTKAPQLSDDGVIIK